MPASLNSILSVAKTGLLSQQLALQIASHNLSNASTPGYSRQRPELVPGPPLLLPEGLLGTGVRVADITRSRDALLDSVYRRESALFHGFAMKHSALGSVESVFAEPGDLSLGASLDAFWNAWSDLSNDPLSSTARAVVVSRGQQLVAHFHRIDASVDGILNQTIDRARVDVADVNRMLSDVADLNTEIAAASSLGNSAPDLEDRRDAILDALSMHVPVTVTARDTGAVGVAINGISVVEGVFSATLSLVSSGGVWSLQTAGGVTIDVDSGGLGSALTLVNTDFAQHRAALDELAQGLVERVNALHTTGTNPLGATGVLFFDDFGAPSTVTAQNIVLDAAILADSQAVAAGTPDGSGNYQAGENDIAVALSGLRDSTTGGILAGRSINDAYRDLVADIGLAVAAARDAETTHSGLMGAAGESRESVSGVATDEELIKVIQIQAAYTAASRLVSVVDEMYQTLLAV